MKKTGSVLILIAFILVLNSGINAQRKPHIMLKGTDLIIPFSSTIVDSSNWEKLGKEALMKVEKVICSNKDYEVMSFTVIVAIGKTVVETTSSSKYWAPKIKETINQLNSGDKVWIEGISTKGPDGNVKMLRNVVFKIK
jgi:hypothetical protein